MPYKLILCCIAVLMTGCTKPLDRSQAAELLENHDDLFGTRLATLTIGNDPFARILQGGSSDAAAIRMGLLVQNRIASKGDVLTEDLKQIMKFSSDNLRRTNLTWKHQNDIYSNTVNMNKAAPFISRSMKVNGNLFISGQPPLAQGGQVAPHTHSYSYDAFELRVPEYTSYLKEVVGIQELNANNSQCNAIVEYVIGFRLEEYGIASEQKAINDRLRKACFALYDDGWRILNPDL